jgi:hypothetical protein
MPISADQIPERVAKQWARRLKDTLDNQGLAPGITLAQAQHCIARQLGYADWHAYQSQPPSSKKETGASGPTPALPSVEDDGVSLFTKATLLQVLVRDRELTPEMALHVMVELYSQGLISYPLTRSAGLPGYQKSAMRETWQLIAEGLPELQTATQACHWENACPTLWDEEAPWHGILPIRTPQESHRLTEHERWAWEQIARRVVTCFSPKQTPILRISAFLDQMETLQEAWLMASPDDRSRASFQEWQTHARQLALIPYAEQVLVQFKQDRIGHAKVSVSLTRKGDRFVAMRIGHRSGTATEQWFQQWLATPPGDGDRVTFAWEITPFRVGAPGVAEFRFRP